MNSTKVKAVIDPQVRQNYFLTEHRQSEELKKLSGRTHQSGNLNSMRNANRSNVPQRNSEVQEISRNANRGRNGRSNSNQIFSKDSHFRPHQSSSSRTREELSQISIKNLPKQVVNVSTKPDLRVKKGSDIAKALN